MTYSYTKPPSNRQLKISERIKSALADVFIKNELHSSALNQYIITISEVRISSDLKIATAFLTFPPDADSDSAMKELVSLTYQVRRIITPQINLKYSPQIRFVLDPLIDYAENIDKLLKATK